MIHSVAAHITHRDSGLFSVSVSELRQIAPGVADVPERLFEDHIDALAPRMRTVLEHVDHPLELAPAERSHVLIEAPDDPRWLLVESHDQLATRGTDHIIDGGAGAFEFQGEGFTGVGAAIQGGEPGQG